MKRTARMYARALYAAADEPGAHGQAIVDQLSAILKQRGERHLFPSIITAYQQLLDSEQGLTRVSLTTVRPSSAEGASNRLEKTLNSKIRLTQHENTQLLGGAQLNIGDTFVDASVKGRLERLRRRLRGEQTLKNDRL